ncbi:MAG: hypothetical protein Q4C81_09975 [Kocuria sp.]|nr:hypothetical protein [Kocuria sp.]
MTAMVYESGMTEWESSGDIDTLSHSVATAAAVLAETVQGQDVAWQSLGEYYEGDQKTELVNGFYVPAENATRVVLAVAAADKALVDFADELRELEQERQRFSEDVKTFNASYGADLLADLPHHATLWRQQLIETPQKLQEKYTTATDKCSTALNAITLENLEVEGISSGRPGSEVRDVLNAAANSALPLDNPFSLMATAGRGLDITRVREPWLRYNDVIPETWQARFLWFNVGPLGASATQGTSSILRAIQTRSWSPIRSMPLAMRMTYRNHSNAKTHTAMTYNDSKGFRKPTWNKFMKLFLDELPITGFVRSVRELKIKRTPATVGKGKPAPKSAHRMESRGALKLNATAKGLGAIGTTYSAVTTYRSEYDKKLQENRAENPKASREEIEKESRHDAGAQTAGNVGSTVLMSAGAGAAAGSILPGPGNVIGFGVGVGVGIAMSFPVADTDSDGQRDSLAEMTGDGAEKLWDFVRGK